MLVKVSQPLFLFAQALARRLTASSNKL